MRFLICLLLVGCAKQPPTKIQTPDGPGYELNYCLETTDCYKEAEASCSKGYNVLEWDGDKPKVIVCRLD